MLADAHRSSKLSRRAVSLYGTRVTPAAVGSDVADDGPRVCQVCGEPLPERMPRHRSTCRLCNARGSLGVQLAATVHRRRSAS